MINKQIVTSGILVSTLFISGCAPSTNSTSSSTSSSNQITFSANATDDNWPREKDQQLNTMLPFIAGIVHNMYENHLLYQPEDPYFFWTSIKYALNQLGSQNIFANFNGTSIEIRCKVLKEYASAMFGANDELPPIPDSLASEIIYLPEQDSYMVIPTDSSTDYKLSVEHLDYVEETDKIYLHINVYDESNGADISSFRVYLGPHPYEVQEAMPVFLSCITHITPHSTADIPSQEDTITNLDYAPTKNQITCTLENPLTSQAYYTAPDPFSIMQLSQMDGDGSWSSYRLEDAPSEYLPDISIVKGNGQVDVTFDLAPFLTDLKPGTYQIPFSLDSIEGSLRLYIKFKLTDQHQVTNLTWTNATD